MKRRFTRTQRALGVPVDAGADVRCSRHAPNQKHRQHDGHHGEAECRTALHPRPAPDPKSVVPFGERRARSGRAAGVDGARREDEADDHELGRERCAERRLPECAVAEQWEDSAKCEIRDARDDQEGEAAPADRGETRSRVPQDACCCRTIDPTSNDGDHDERERDLATNPDRGCEHVKDNGGQVERVHGTQSALPSAPADQPRGMYAHMGSLSRGSPVSA